MKLCLAGWTVELSFEEPEDRVALQHLFAHFQTEAPAESQLLVRRGLEGFTSSGPRILPEAHPMKQGGVKLSQADIEAELSPQGREGWVKGRSIFAVENALKFMLAQVLAERQGLLVHGVCVEAQGRALLFTGPSGAGKSTLAQLWKGSGGRVLADELVALWPLPEGGFRAAGTPWNTGIPAEASLQGVGVLAWGESSDVSLKSPSEVARTLLGNSLLPEVSAAGRAQLLAASSALLKTVSALCLRFARDESASRAIRAALETERS